MLLAWTTARRAARIGSLWQRTLQCRYPKEFRPDAGFARGTHDPDHRARRRLGPGAGPRVRARRRQRHPVGPQRAKLDRVYDEIEALGAPQPAIARPGSGAWRPRWNTTAGARPSAREFGKLDGLVHAAALAGRSHAPGAIRRAHLVQGVARESDRAVHPDAGACCPNLRKSADASVIFVSSGVVKQPRALLGRLRGRRRPDSNRCAAMLVAGTRGRGEHSHQQRESRAACAPPCAPPPIRRKTRTQCRRRESVTRAFFVLAERTRSRY